MTVDTAALAAHLENDARYDEAVRSGNNGASTKLVNDTQTGAGLVWDDMPAAEFMAAIAAEPLDATQLTWVQLQTQNGASVQTSEVNVQTWITDNLSSGVAAAIKASQERSKTWAEEAGVSDQITVRIGISEVRKAVKLISKSFIVTRGTHPNAVDVGQAEEQAIRDATGRDPAEGTAPPQRVDTRPEDKDGGKLPNTPTTLPDKG